MAVDDSGLGGGFLGNLPPNARIGIIVGGAVVLVALIMWMILGGGDNEDDGYRTVFENLPMAEAGNAKDFLEREYRIPVKLTDHGTTLRVPKDKAQEALVKLAQNNMPSSGIIGYEIFDKGSFISTDFEKKVSLQRAMNGELSRLIKRFDGVQDARVNVVVPEPALFSEEQLPTTASVLIEFNRGGGFGPGSVEAITHMIASAVPGLKPGNVTVVDTNGLMLSEGQMGLGEGDGKKQFTKQLDEQLRVQRRMENFLENKIVMMLEKVLGPGNVRATVTGKFDFDRIQRRKRMKQPVLVDDPANPGKKILTMLNKRQILEKTEKVAGETKGANKEETAPGAGTDPDAPPPPVADPGDVPKDTSDRENLQATYNYDSIEELITQQTGVMISKAISVQFQVPKKEGEGEEDAEGGPGKIDSEAVEKMVQAAIHYNPKLGDQLDVRQVKFDDTVYKKLKEEMEKARQGTPIWYFIVVGLLAFLVGGGIGGVLLGKKKAPATDAFGAGAPGAVPGGPAYAAIPPPGGEAGAPGAPGAPGAEGAPGGPPAAPGAPAPQAQEVTRAPVMPATPDNPFVFLEGVNPQTVAQLLSTERLPTLVAVLAQLEPGQAEDVISLLNPEIQNEVRTRLAQNPVLPPMTQKMVSQSLKKRLASLSSGVG